MVQKISDQKEIPLNAETLEGYFKEFNQQPTQETKNQYPFNIVKSNVSKNCLTDNKGGISINECKSLEGQKWFGLRNKPQNCF